MFTKTRQTRLCMQMIKQVDQAYLSVLFQNKEYKLGTLFAFLKILYFVPL